VPGISLQELEEAPGGPPPPLPPFEEAAAQAAAENPELAHNPIAAAIEESQAVRAELRRELYEGKEGQSARDPRRPGEPLERYRRRLEYASEQEGAAPLALVQLQEIKTLDLKPFKQEVSRQSYAVRVRHADPTRLRQAQEELEQRERYWNVRTARFLEGEEREGALG